MFNPRQPLVICEGESDTAAVLNLGFNAIGRASATSCLGTITKMVRNPKVFIVADTDSGVGLSSAKLLKLAIKNSVVVHNPAYKDIRVWINSGLFTMDSFLEHVLED